jgi:hypothetical protein
MVRGGGGGCPESFSVVVSCWAVGRREEQTHGTPFPFLAQRFPDGHSELYVAQESRELGQATLLGRRTHGGSADGAWEAILAERRGGG